MEIDRLVLSAGGHLGVAFVGSIRILEQKYGVPCLARKFRSFEGTSAGAICAFMLSLGMSSLEIFMYYQQVPEYLPQLSTLSLSKGLSKIDTLANSIIVSALLRYGFQPEEIKTLTFSQLFNRTKKRTVLGITVIGPYDASIDASHETVPDWPVLPCLLSSMAIPGVFEPVLIETPHGPVYAVDGAISNSFRFPGKSHYLLFSPPVSPQQSSFNSISIPSNQAAVCSKPAAVCSNPAVVCNKSAAVCNKSAAVCSKSAAVCSKSAAVCSKSAAKVPGVPVGAEGSEFLSETPSELPVDETGDDVLGILLFTIPCRVGYSPETHSIWDYSLFIMQRFFHYLAANQALRQHRNLITIKCKVEVGILSKPSPDVLLQLISAGETACTEFLNKM